MNKAIKKTWRDIKGEVKKLNPVLVDIFEQIGLDDEVVYEVNYPYGATIADENFLYMPDENGKVKKISTKSYPYMILMDKSLELYLETGTRTAPNLIYRPGDFMPMTIELSPNGLASKPNSPFRLVSGARSVSLMPLTTNNHAFYTLKGKHGFVADDEISNQFEIFKTISNNLNSKWRSKLYIFDTLLCKKVRTEPKFRPLLMMLYEQSIRLNSFNRNSIYLDYAITEILTSRNINIRPFSTEIIKQIILIALGAGIGFGPLDSEQKCPLKELTEEMLSVYTPTTTPIFIGPVSNFSLNDKCYYLPIPYFQHSINDPKKFRPVFYLHEVIRYIPTILEDFKRHKLTEDCIYADLIDILDLKYYTERGNDEMQILPVKDLVNDDSRFQSIEQQHIEPCRFGICSKAPFSKALIGIQLKRTAQ